MIENSYLNEFYNIIIDHSCKIRKDDIVIIEVIDIPGDHLLPLLKKLTDRGALPIVNLKNQNIMHHFALNAMEKHYELLADLELEQMKRADCFIGLRNIQNPYDFSDIPDDKYDVILKKFIEPVHYNYRNKRLKWLYFRYPSQAMAQNAGMNFCQFAEYYFKAVNINYDILNELIEPLEKILLRTDNIKIMGPETDLEFSIKNMNIVKDLGAHNLPDGEIATAPLKNSINGIIKFNIDSIFQGSMFSDIKLEFLDGRIMKAESTKNNNKLQNLINTDEGARYIGEFAFGLNPFIDVPIKDILFDEKMYGSFHFAIGNSYPKANNGNRSAIHWDLIQNQKKEYGGGKIFLNGKLIMEDGLFVFQGSEKLKPQNLKNSLKINEDAS